MLCALGPIACLATLAHIEISRSLETQAFEALSKSVKVEASYIFERLRLAEQDLARLAESGDPIRMCSVLHDRLGARFASLTLFEQDKPEVHLLGSKPKISFAAAPEDLVFLRSGKSLAVECGNPEDGLPPSIYLACQAVLPGYGEGILAGEILPGFLWPEKEIDTLLGTAGLAVLDSRNDLLFATEAALFDLRDRFKDEVRDSVLGHFEFNFYGKRNLASHTQLFLKGTYRLPYWTVVLFMPKQQILKSVTQFRRNLSLVMLGSVLFALLLGSMRIRKRMVPVEKLIDGVKRIEEGDFSHPIELTGGQEFDQITKAFNRMSESLGRSVADLREMSWGALNALARAVDAKSPWTAGHSQRVTALALELGAELGLEPEALEELHRAALMHDVGKIAVHPYILDKPGKLTEEEFLQIKAHSAAGAKILEAIPAFRGMIPIVVQHHERFDGRGYPAGLSGRNIHFGARIIAVVDTFDALTSDRPYRPGMKTKLAIDIIHQEAGSQFDPEVVDRFMVLMERKGLSVPANEISTCIRMPQLSPSR